MLWKSLKKIAHEGHAPSQYVLGKLYFFGEGGLLVDREKALELFKKAESQGDVKSTYAIGIVETFSFFIKLSKALLKELGSEESGDPKKMFKNFKKKQEVVFSLKSSVDSIRKQFEKAFQQGYAYSAVQLSLIFF